MRQNGSSVRFVGPGVLFLLVVALYLPSYGNDFVYDDGIEVQRLDASPRWADIERSLTQPHYPGLPYYRPVTRASLLLDRGLFGDRPGPYRAVNAALAGLAALLAYAILRTQALGATPRPIAFAAGAVFALHPVASSVVYSISCRGTLLQAVLGLLAVNAYLRGGARRTWVALPAVAASLFSKEQAITLPLLLVWADALGIAAGAPGRSPVRWLLRLAPLAAIVTVYEAARAAVTASVASQVALARDPLAPLLSLAYALQVTLTPFVELRYEPPEAVWLSPPRLVVCALAVALFAAAVARAEPTLRRRLWFFIGWLGLALLPTANLLVQETRFDERYVFFAAFGIVGAVAVLATAAWRRERARTGIVAAGAALVIACAVVSVHRSAAFRDDRAFASQWLHTNPDAIQAHKLLADVLAAEGDDEGAEAHYLAALRIEPLFFKAHANYANLLFDAGRSADAIAHAAIAVRLDPTNPRMHRNLARMYAAEDRLDLAARHYRRALELDPRNLAVAIPLAKVLARLGRPAAAAEWYRVYLRADPGNVKVHYELGKLLVLAGQHAAAVSEFEAALALEPKHAGARRALSALVSGNAGAALE